MSKVYDASALLAILNDETGQDVVISHLASSEEGLISAANWAEVASKLAVRGESPAEIEFGLAAFGLEVVSLDASLALAAGALRPITKSIGLSLGDRCCIALAAVRGAEIITGERIWAQLPKLSEIPAIKQLKITQIR
jgi:PIN domain nuclease of toxin-antitoxin system